MMRVAVMIFDHHRNHDRQGVWVPAYAGTTIFVWPILR